MQEIFKPCSLLKENYLVSNFGNVINITTNKLLVGVITKKGYKRLIFRDRPNKITKYYFVHRLVAETFIPKIYSKIEVNHIDSNRLNNNANNLEWCTRAENIKHSFTSGNKSHIGIKNPNSKHFKSNNSNIETISSQV